MDVTFFSFWSVSSETPLTVALLIGIFLLVVGLLLLLLPRSERRSQKSTAFKRSKASPTVVPGYRIRSEQARVPRQFLSVPRIAVLDPQRSSHPTSTAAVASTEAFSITAEAQDHPDALDDAPTLSFSLLAEAEQPPTKPGKEKAEEADQATLITLDQPGSIAMPAVDMPPEQEQETDSLSQPDSQPEQLTEPLSAATPPVSDDTAPDAPAAPTLHADSDDTEPNGAPAPESAAAPLEPAPPEPEAADLPEVEEQSAEPDEPSPAEVAEFPPNADAEPQQDAIPQPPIRKARLSSVFSEVITERSFTKDALPLAQPPPLPEPQPPQSAARRARLTGFPHPAAQVDSAALTNHLEDGDADQQQISAVSASEASAEGAALSVPGTANAQRGDKDAITPSDSDQPPQPEGAETPALLRVVCFGTVDILTNGKPLSPLDSRFRSSREFELMAFLAYSAALRRQTFVDRSAITEALLSEEMDEDSADESAEESEESFTNRRSPLGGWKYRLCRRLRGQGIPDHAWLESRADGALRLRAEVQIDVVEFLQVSSHLRKARDQMRRFDAKQPKRDDVLAWLQQLRHLYRDRGEFAEQFQLQEWTQEPRRRYRNVYWHALFYAAELLAALEERQTAIQLAEELVEQEEVETEVVYEALLTWLHEDGNKSDLLRWLNTYRQWYAAVHDNRSLDMARPDLLARLNPGIPPNAPPK